MASPLISSLRATLISLGSVSIVFLPLLPRASVASAESIQVGLHENPPKIFVNPQGEPDGFFIDLLEHMAEVEGWRLDYVLCQWDECLTQVENGDLDLMPDVAYSAERAERFDFNQETVINSWSTIYTRPDLTINSLLQLEDKKVAVVEGSIQAEDLADLVEDFGIGVQLVRVEDFEAVFQVLQSQSADAGLVNRFFGVRSAQHYDLVSTDILLMPTSLRFMAPAGGNSDLLNRIDINLIDLKQDPGSIYYQAKQQWLDLDLGSSIDRKSVRRLMIGIVSIAMMVILGLIIAWNRSLARLIRQLRSSISEQTTLNKKLQTARRDLETQVALRTRELRTYLNTLPDYVHVVDPMEMKLIWCNDRWAQLMGFRDQTQILGRTLYEIFPKQDIEEIIRQNQRICEKGRTLHYSDTLTWSDTLLYLDTYKIPLPGPEGQIYALLTNSRDISELTRTKQALMERNQELQRIIEYEQLLRLITDHVRSSLDEDQILQIAIQELTRQLDLGFCHVSLFDPEQDQFVIRYSCLGSISYFPAQSAEVLDPGLLEQLKQGETIYFSCIDNPQQQHTAIINPIQDQDFILGFLQLSRPPDQEFGLNQIRLSEQIANQCAIAIRQARLYQTTQRQVKDLEALNTLKDEFVHMVSHELRTPLTNMKMAIRMVETGEITERQTRYLKILEAEWQRELKLVNNLLDLVALESGTKAIQIKTHSIQEWSHEFLEPFRLRCQEQEQQFEIDQIPNAYTFATDYELTSRILSELLNNACKYTPAHERIEFSVYPQDQGLRFQVINTGVEIPAEQLTRIFEKFYRSPPSGQQQSGTGLGLALVQKSVELLGGQIQVESDHHSTRFTVDLPNLMER